MAQSSRPQAGNVNTFPTYVDAGPYTADQWARMYRKLLTTDQHTTQGPLLGVNNELAVTFGVGTLNVYVNTGAGICNGHFLENTASVTIAVTPPAGGARTDYVCMVENNSNAAIAPGATYNTEGGASIPPYSCRLAVVRNGPVNFTQTNLLYMVRLATINTQAAYIGSITDNRVFCQFATDLQDNVVTTTKILNLAVTTAKINDDAVIPSKIPDRTRTFLVQSTLGYNTTDGTSITPTSHNTLLLPHNKVACAWAHFAIPQDYASGMTVQAVVYNTAPGNVYVLNSAAYGQCGEVWTTHSDDSTWSVVALVPLFGRHCIASISMTNATAGDLVDVTLSRGGLSSSDTGGNLAVLGWLVTYTADS